MITVNWNQLSQSELAKLVISTLVIVERHDPQVMGVKPFYDLLNATEPQLGLLTATRIAHPLTPNIATDDKRARELCLAIVTQLRAVSKSKVAVYESALFMMEPLAKKYLANNYQSNREKLNDSLRNFLDAVTANETIADAAKVLSIDVYITELGAVKSRIDQNSASRSVDFVAQRAVKELQLRKTINKAMSDLLKAIDLAKVTNKAFNFGAFDTEIGVLFTGYRSKLRSRATRRINNVIKKESVATTSKSVATETLENGLV